MKVPTLSRWQWLYLQLIVMMCVMMAVSFLPEHFHEFFGDWKCAGSGDFIEKHWRYERCNYADRNYHLPTWHWGWRHWLLTLFGVVFCIVNVARLIAFWERRPNV